MLELTGVKDVDDIIYDYVFGDRKKPDKTLNNKLVEEFKNIMFNVDHGNGTMKGTHNDNILPPPLFEYLENVSFNEMYDTNGQYRDYDKNDIIYL